MDNNMSLQFCERLSEVCRQGGYEREVAVLSKSPNASILAFFEKNNSDCELPDWRLKIRLISVQWLME